MTFVLLDLDLRVCRCISKWTTAAAHILTELLTLLGSHVLPPLHHPLPPMHAPAWPALKSTE